jgi:hypothetical protein
MSLYSKKVVPLYPPHKLKRRDAPMIVKTYSYADGTVVHIDDSYVARTDEEKEKVDTEIAAAAWAIVESLEGA